MTSQRTQTPRPPTRTRLAWSGMAMSLFGIEDVAVRGTPGMEDFVLVQLRGSSRKPRSHLPNTSAAYKAVAGKRIKIIFTALPGLVAAYDGIFSRGRRSAHVDRSRTPSTSRIRTLCDTLTGTIRSDNSRLEFGRGREKFNTNILMGGRNDDVAIYDYGLSEEQVAKHYKAARVGTRIDILHSTFRCEKAQRDIPRDPHTQICAERTNSSFRRGAFQPWTFSIDVRFIHRRARSA